MTCGRGSARAGFVLPLALFVVTIVALLASMLLQASLEDLRVARGEVAGARAQAAAESALADLLATAPDSVALGLARGAATTIDLAAGSETTKVAVQSLGGRLVRVTAAARVWSEGVRADAEHVAFLRIIPDSGGPPGSLRYQRLPGWWWAPVP